jgi:uncharacterized RDD family membrane protein YckC
MTNSNDTIKIDTPENVTFDYDTAGIGSRFLAALVDTIIIIFLQLIVFGTTLLLFNIFFESLSLEDSLTWILAILGLISFALLWGYYILFEILWNGQSPGKRLVGLRVIRVDGTPISASESVIRNLVRLIDFLPLAYGVGVVTMFIDTNSRRVGDLAAGTVVVHDRQLKGLNELSTGTLSSSILQNAVPQEFPIEKLTPHDLEIIEEFLLRRDELSNRGALARHILKSLITRLDLTDSLIPLDRAEDILAAIYKITRTRNSEE